jgi:hypothetical protein
METAPRETSPKGDQREAAIRHPGTHYFDTTVPGRGLSIDRGKFFPAKPKDFSASFVSPCERPEISWHNG